MNKFTKSLVLIGAIVFTTLIIAHSPWTGYKTNEFDWVTTECWKPGEIGCTKPLVREIFFSQWTTYEPLVKWLGNVQNMLIVSVALMAIFILAYSLFGRKED
jgi:energy-coupling factor transporter transmembrane protein EcfT